LTDARDSLYWCTLTYHELVDFLTTKMRMSHVYQPLLIRALVDAGGIATIQQLARAFLVQDEGELLLYERRIKTMPLPVLKNRGVVESDGEVVRLTTRKLTFAQKATVRRLCEQRLQEYIERRGLAIWDARLLSSEPVPGSVYYAVMKRARGRCALCGATRDDSVLHVDHIIPRKRWNKTLGPDVNDISNLQVLCSKCNTTKRDTDDTDFRVLPSDTDPNCPFCSTRRRAGAPEYGSVVALTDMYPVTADHTLIIPKRHVADYFELSHREREDANDLLRLLRNQACEKDKRITGFNVGVNAGTSAGQTVMHCHIHLIPRRDGDMDDPRGGVRGVIPAKQKYS